MDDRILHLTAGGLATTLFAYFLSLFVKGTVVAAVVALLSYGVGFFLASRGSSVQVYQPKSMFQGNVSYLSPNDGYRLIQAAMERSGLVKEERK